MKNVHQNPSSKRLKLALRYYKYHNATTRLLLRGSEDWGQSWL